MKTLRERSFTLIAGLVFAASLFVVGCQKQSAKTSPSTGGAVEDLITAAKAGEMNRVKELLQSGADVNAQTKYKEFALLSAITEKRTDIARYLLQNGANPNLTDISGQSPRSSRPTNRTQKY